MANKSFGKKLKYELLKSPKKAALLGIMLVTALYFWAPLVWKMFPSKETANTTLATTPIVAPQTNTIALPAKTQANQPWNELIEWMEADPRKSLPTSFVSERDPFQTLNEPVQEIVNPRTVEAKEDIVTPEDLGLILTSTIVSAGRSTASINGKAYQTGQEFMRFYKDRTVTLELREVHSRFVLIAVDGNLFKLMIARPASTKVRIYQPE